MPSGGKRKGSGQKKKFNCPTTLVKKVVPIEKVKDFHEKADEILNQYKQE